MIEYRDIERMIGISGHGDDVVYILNHSVRYCDTGEVSKHRPSYFLFDPIRMYDTFEFDTNKHYVIAKRKYLGIMKTGSFSSEQPTYALTDDIREIIILQAESPLIHPYLHIYKVKDVNTGEVFWIKSGDWVLFHAEDVKEEKEVDKDEDE